MSEEKNVSQGQSFDSPSEESAAQSEPISVGPNTEQLNGQVPASTVQPEPVGLEQTLEPQAPAPAEELVQSQVSPVTQYPAQVPSPYPVSPMTGQAPLSPSVVEQQVEAQPQSQASQDQQQFVGRQPVGQPQQPAGQMPVNQPQQPAGQVPPPSYGAHPQQPYPAQTQQPYSGQQTWQAQPYQPGQSAYGQAPVAQVQPSGSGNALAALLCGIFAILFSGLVVVGVILGIVAVVLATKYVKSFGKDSKATGGKVCGILGIIFSVLALVAYIAFASLINSAYQNSYYDYGYSYTVPDSNSGSGSSGSGDEATDNQAILPVFEEALEGMRNPTNAEVDALAQEYEGEFFDILGFTMQEAGIDSRDVVAACASSIEYEPDDDAYIYSREATAYASVYSCDIWSYLDAFYDTLLELEGQGDAPILAWEETTPEDKIKIGELFLSVMNPTDSVSTEKYVAVEFDYLNGTWKIDQDSLWDETEFVYGLS